MSFLETDKQFKASGSGEPNHGAANSPESQLLGKAVTEVPELVATADPTTYLTPDAPPFLIKTGSSRATRTWPWCTTGLTAI